MSIPCTTVYLPSPLPYTVNSHWHQCVSFAQLSTGSALYLASVIICRKYGDPRMILEVGYNLTYSWHKYSFDADCCLVLKMLMGMLPFFTAAAVVLCSVSRCTSESRNEGMQETDFV